METQTPQTTTSQEKRIILFAIVLVICSSILTFVSGFTLSSLLQKEKENTNVPTPTPDPYGKPQETTSFLPGKHYFEDEIYIVTKTVPRQILVMSAVRSQTDSNTYGQNQRISFFNGQEWKRKIENRNSPDSSIVTSPIISKWHISIDPSRVLKESIETTAIIDDTSISFTSDTLTNEISMRSLPGYTKFMSEGTGILNINGLSMPAHILSTHIYSLNQSEIQFYSEPLGLTTDWLAFWDETGTFYHIDSTTVDRPTKLYSSHKIAIKKSNDGSISKTFSLDVSRDSEIPPAMFSFQLPFANPVTIKVNKESAINKAPNTSSQWYLLEISGTATINGSSVQGYGIMEYIKD